MGRTLATVKNKWHFSPFPLRCPSNPSRNIAWWEYALQIRDIRSYLYCTTLTDAFEIMYCSPTLQDPVTNGQLSTELASYIIHLLHLIKPRVLYRAAQDILYFVCLALMVRDHWCGIICPLLLWFLVSVKHSAGHCCHIGVFLGHIYLTNRELIFVYWLHRDFSIILMWTLLKLVIMRHCLIIVVCKMHFSVTFDYFPLVPETRLSGLK